MDETNEQKEQTVQKYLLLMNMICTMENRLVRSEMVYLIINIIIHRVIKQYQPTWWRMHCISLMIKD